MTGRALRVVLFVSGCLLRCTYCHNPDTWHLKDGTYVSVAAGDRPAGELCAGAALARRRAHHLRRRADGADGVHRRDSCRRQGAWAAHRDRDVGLSRRPGRRQVPVQSRSRAARHQELESGDLQEGHRPRSGADACASPSGSPKIGKPAWVRFTLVPGHTDDPDNVEGIARFVAPMKNVEWVEVQPFHQLGAFKWKAMGLAYEHDEHADPDAGPDRPRDRPIPRRRLQRALTCSTHHPDF